MIIDWTQNDHGTVPPLNGSSIRAAEYVRMSTEHQKYSTDNQSSLIRRYAEARGFEIVRTYSDEGKSGLRLVGRDALQTLLQDVTSGRADFTAILVYDVSRWGRFQDPDEAAAIELQCKRSGIAVHYCAEQFVNDGSIGSSIVKTVKRAMAGEYSRELSVKVFAGQANLIRLGYRQGGAPGLGLRRILVDQFGNFKSQLEAGEHKSIATDRIVLRPGPAAEIGLVREVYDAFIHGATEADIAASLNARSIVTDLGRRWTRGTVHQLLINEKYIGNNVWGRTSFKLKHKHRRNPREEWIRADGAFEAIVPLEQFERVQELIAARSERFSDDELLKKLANILEQRGQLSGLIIDEFDNGPSSSTYASRFGSLLRAYALVGFVPDRDYRYLEINKELRRLHPNIVHDAIRGLRKAGAEVSDGGNGLLLVNNEITLSVVVARCLQLTSGSCRWKIRLDSALKPDITIAARMAIGNTQVQDYYVLPMLDMQEAVIRLCDFNGLSLDAYRVGELNSFYELFRRRHILEVA